jgi:hypothetical protein
MMMNKNKNEKQKQRKEKTFKKGKKERKKN